MRPSEGRHSLERHPHAVYRPLNLTLTISAGCVMGVCVHICVRACIEVYMWFGGSDGFTTLRTLFPLSVEKPSRP